MKKVIVFILLLFIWAILWSLPLWIAANFVCWVSHISYHLTLLQSFAICICATIIRKLLFKKED